MAKHRRPTTTVTRNLATATAVAAGAALLAPAANAAEVRVPNTNLSVDVQGIENVPGIENIPGVTEWIPSLAQQETTNYTAPAPAAPVAAVKTTGERIVEIARTKIGSPYVYGASGPDAFDCSGFTSWVYAQAGKSIPRTSQAQANGGTPVPLDQLQPGDIVAYYGGASHVAIYAGNGKIIDALNSGTPVGERPLHMMPVHSAFRF
ncbi:C40 family peptidase [Corynebacterium timonense]|uniref:Cell wall-associated hydrolase, NlpC family n=1 Tax=Corynebacterium timonense TaxID=441500 RepID=A0A1H1MIM9_9CORY|nr:C40 family peptidase [Corynebacterium timonense]SDR86490.1 Cell wall-associated hydrolase, NlpC family [Corynebacterium timonense]